MGSGPWLPALSGRMTFAEYPLAELRWIENRPYNAWRLPEGLRSNPGAEDDAENQG